MLWNNIQHQPLHCHEPINLGSSQETLKLGEVPAAQDDSFVKRFGEEDVKQENLENVRSSLVDGTQPASSFEDVLHSMLEIGKKDKEKQDEEQEQQDEETSLMREDKCQLLSGHKQRRTVLEFTE